MIQNLKFLQDFWIHVYEVPPEQEAQVLTLVTTAPGISVRQLQDACPDLPVDVLWALLTDHRLFTNLSASSLMQWDQVRLFRSQAEAESARERAESMPAPIPLFTQLSFDGRLWEAEKQGDRVVLRPEVGTALTLSTTYLQQLLDTGAATLVGEAAPSPLSEEARTLLLGAGPTALAAANQRLSIILAYLMRDAVSYALDLLKVKAVCVDEAQHLMQADAAHKPSIQLDWLKSLTNRSNLLYILVGNFSLYDFCHLNGQLARRVREEQFCRYHLDQQTDAVEFTSALKVLLEQVPLQVNIPEMLTHWKWFGEWSIGCIGILSDWVVETASTLCRAGETVLSLEALAKHALKPAQRLKLETEARTGEFKIEEAKKDVVWLINPPKRGDMRQKDKTAKICVKVRPAVHILQ